MAIINSELTVAVQKSIDGKMFKIVGVQHVPYDSIADVISNIVSTRRHIGQVFRYIDGGGISDCHFIGGIADINLVKIDTDTNFANTDLTAAADRVHDFAGKNLTIKNLESFSILGQKVLTTVSFVAGSPVPLFTPDSGSGYDQLIIPDTVNDATIQVILNVGGTDTAPLTFTLFLSSSGYSGYRNTPTAGAVITCVSYEGNLLTSIPVEINVPKIAYDVTKQVAVFDGEMLKRETLPAPDGNFANNNLTADNDRTHDFANHLLLIKNLSGIQFINNTSPTFNIAGGDADGSSAQINLFAYAGVLKYGFALLPSSVYKYANFYAQDTTNFTRVYLESNKMVLENVEVSDGVTPQLLNLFIRILPVYDTEAAAVTGGLLTDQIYKTTTGELRIKL